MSREFYPNFWAKLTDLAKVQIFYSALDNQLFHNLIILVPLELCSPIYFFNLIILLKAALDHDKKQLPLRGVWLHAVIDTAKSV